MPAHATPIIATAKIPILTSLFISRMFLFHDPSSPAAHHKGVGENLAHRRPVVSAPQRGSRIRRRNTYNGICRRPYIASPCRGRLLNRCGRSRHGLRAGQHLHGIAQRLRVLFRSRLLRGFDFRRLTLRGAGLGSLRFRRLRFGRLPLCRRSHGFGFGGGVLRPRLSAGPAHRLLADDHLRLGFCYRASGAAAASSSALRVSST